MKSFDDSVSEFDLTITRLEKRETINIEVYGPEGEFVEKFAIPAGFGVNLRRELQSRDFRLYDESTYRFDSPYQTGDCGGEGNLCIFVLLFFCIDNRIQKQLQVRVEPALFR